MSAAEKIVKYKASALSKNPSLGYKHTTTYCENDFAQSERERLLLVVKILKAEGCCVPRQNTIHIENARCRVEVVLLDENEIFMTTYILLLLVVFHFQRWHLL